MEKILNKMFENGMFSNIFYADQNPAIINFKKTIKENGKLKTIDNSITYELTSLITDNNEDSITWSLLHNFFVSLNFSSERVDLKYFDRGLLRNLLTKRDPDIILDHILNYNWIIASPNMIEEISKVKGFEWTENDTLIKLRGRFNYQFNDTLVFELPSNPINSNIYKQFTNNVIYCGNFDSITPVINRNIKEVKDGVVIEYIFNTKENLKKLIIT